MMYAKAICFRDTKILIQPFVKRHCFGKPFIYGKRQILRAVQKLPPQGNAFSLGDALIVLDQHRRFHCVEPVADGGDIQIRHGTLFHMAPGTRVQPAYRSRSFRNQFHSSRCGQLFDMVLSSRVGMAGRTPRHYAARRRKKPFHRYFLRLIRQSLFSCSDPYAIAQKTRSPEELRAKNAELPLAATQTSSPVRMRRGGAFLPKQKLTLQMTMI